MAGILPPAFGDGNMLDLTVTGTEQFDALTKFKLFEWEDATRPPESIPPAPKQATSHKRLRNNDKGNNTNRGCSTTHTAGQVPQLFASAALANAVSQVKLRMDRWESLHILRLFVVLVDPPQDLVISDTEGFHDYLTQLVVELGSLIDNGVRGITSHCWCALLGKCSTPNLSPS